MVNIKPKSRIQLGVNMPTLGLEVSGASAVRIEAPYACSKAEPHSHDTTKSQSQHSRSTVTAHSQHMHSTAQSQAPHRHRYSHGQHIAMHEHSTGTVTVTVTVTVTDTVTVTCSAAISSAEQPVMGWLYPLQPILRICGREPPTFTSWPKSECDWNTGKHWIGS